jgi:hypothetical protein
MHLETEEPYKYNRLGQTVWTRDQNETVHEYAFDGLGRQTDDCATAFGTNVDRQASTH